MVLLKSFNNLLILDSSRWWSEGSADSRSNRSKDSMWGTPSYIYHSVGFPAEANFLPHIYLHIPYTTPLHGIPHFCAKFFCYALVHATATKLYKEV